MDGLARDHLGAGEDPLRGVGFLCSRVGACGAGAVDGEEEGEVDS